MPTVLVMEPDRELGALMHALLSEEACRPLVVHSIETAVDCLRREQVAVIVTELLDHVNGGPLWEAPRRLREVTPTTPILVFTHHSDARDASAIEGVVEALLVKPIDLDRLVNRVAELASERCRGATPASC